MKNLKDTILEKLKVDDIVLNGEFPIDGTLEEIVEFLEDTGFKEVPNLASWDKTFKNYKKYNVKCFDADRGSHKSIKIINRSNPRFKNKLFYIKLNPEDKYYEDKYNIFDDITTAKTQCWDARYASKEEFLEELSEIL